jgi:hypothetical protein
VSGAYHDGAYAEVDQFVTRVPPSVCHALLDCIVSAAIANLEAEKKAKEPVTPPLHNNQSKEIDINGR